MRLISYTTSAAAFSMLVTVANAAPIAFVVDTQNDNLFSIDLGTGTTSIIGAIGFGDVKGLSFQPGIGVLFAMDDASDQLITIDTTTGAGTVADGLGIDF